MTMPVEKHDRFSVEEYLRLEEKATDKHEYRDGEILAMSGGSYEHSRISANLIGTLVAALKGKPCFPLESNMKVRIPPSNLYVYPDATIVCGQPQFDPLDAKRGAILNPRVIFEVLSPSTSAYDRGEKFDDYRLIPGLEEYVLINQFHPQVDSFLRQQDGSWSFISTQGRESTAMIRCLSLELPLSEVYAGLELPGKSP